MTKTAKGASLSPLDVLQNMIPGERYTLHEIMTRSGFGISSTKTALAAYLLQGQIRSGIVHKRTVYWRPTEEELGLERQTAEQQAQAQATLTGYDASIRQVQKLSMLARPRPDSEQKN